MKNLRSLLFVPGDKNRLLERAHAKGSDAIVIDLEDGVSPAAKPAARAAFGLSASGLKARGATVFARINSDPEDIKADLDVVVCPAVSAIAVPKVEDPDALAALAATLDEMEDERGLPKGSIAVLALIESPAAVAHLNAIAAAPRVAGLALGSEDFSLQLGVPPTPACLDLPCRMLALAAAAGQVAAFGLPTSIADVADQDSFRAAAEHARAFGMTGTFCIHPTQVAIINAVFSPTDQEIAEARKVLSAWEGATAKGLSVVMYDGRMLDLPVVERARRLLDRADAKH